MMFVGGSKGALNRLTAGLALLNNLLDSFRENRCAVWLLDETSHALTSKCLMCFGFTETAGD